ncbi:hypothetical protein IV203_025793 [Nitzschia inconspicua]|uniref:Uncharacterized protein n=1 Tax=Nitzschia inconspicua TaxID=303405 RepID=A0A9K3PW96_9STRA|nr:hypothetical protein IV203_025793 [Nitzschia inconspicua]
MTEEHTLDSEENAFGFMDIVMGATKENQEQNGCGVCLPMLVSVFESIGNVIKEDKILTEICIHKDEMTEKESESAGNNMRTQSSPSQTLHDMQEVVCNAISLPLYSGLTATLPTQVHFEKFTPECLSYREKNTKNRKIWGRTKLWFCKKLLCRNQTRSIKSKLMVPVHGMEGNGASFVSTTMDIGHIKVSNENA